MRPSSLNIGAFVEELLEALAGIDGILNVSVQAEGPTVNGRAFLNGDKFLAFYFNQVTGTQAFALVEGNKRIWGLDYDNIRGWHIHPIEAPDEHHPIGNQNIAQIVEKFGLAIQ